MYRSHRCHLPSGHDVDSPARRGRPTTATSVISPPTVARRRRGNRARGDARSWCVHRSRPRRRSRWHLDARWVGVTTVNYLGVEKTARLTRVLLALILATLALVVAAGLGASPTAGLENLTTDLPAGPWGVLRSAGLLFFAFAGYARLATLGEEVVDPETTIPRAIPVALGIVVAIYAAVLGTALWAVGPSTIATVPAPLAEVVARSDWSQLTGLVRAGAAVAAAGVLLSLLAGVSRTALSMARRRELPRFLDAVHPRHATPHRAEITAAVLVSTVVMVVDLRNAIGFSSFAVLTYYALANASALRLSDEERRWPRWLARLGLILCLVIAVTLPVASVVGGLVVLAAGTAVWFITGRHRIA